MGTVATIALGLAALTFPPLTGHWDGVRHDNGGVRRWTTGGYLRLQTGYDRREYHFEVSRRQQFRNVWSLRLEVSR